MFGLIGGPNESIKVGQIQLTNAPGRPVLEEPLYDMTVDSERGAELPHFL